MLVVGYDDIVINCNDEKEMLHIKKLLSRSFDIAYVVSVAN
jgi:hypothetical protein